MSRLPIYNFRKSHRILPTQQFSGEGAKVPSIITQSVVDTVLMFGHYFWKFLLFLLTVAFVAVKKIKAFFRLALLMLYNRQKRAKLFKSFILSEDEVLNRLSKLSKLPKEVVICVGSGQKLDSNNKGRIESIREWTERLDIAKCKTYTLKQQSFLEQEASANHSLESFHSFYSTFLEQVNTSQYQRGESTCPLILVFNSIPYLSGLPFTEVRGGEILFCNDLQTFSIVDYEECLKRYAKTQQRLGK